jgi:hypothetical protein
MDVLRLRKLTRKSLLGFGKDADLTIGNMLDLQKTRYLRWVYFNCSMLTFMDDILDQIGIIEEFRIEKPGKDSEKHEELNNEIDLKRSGFSKFKHEAHHKRVRKAEFINFRKRDSIRFSKSIMQRKNHGH